MSAEVPRAQRVPALRLALATLTVVPIRAGVPALATAGRAMLLAPLVGVMVGAASGAVAVAAGGRSPLLGASLGVGVAAQLTRGLHLDGLADTADGLGSMAPPERAREIMRAGDVGAFGVAALVLALLVQVAALAALVDTGDGLAAGALAGLVSRTAVPLACRRGVAAADPSGLGAAVAESVRPWAALAWGAVAVAAGALLGPRGAVSAALALLAAEALLRHCRRRLGGLTGDVVGALVEAAATAVLVGLAIGRSATG